MWLFMGRAHEWQRRAAKLMQARFDVGKQFDSIPNFTVLPRRFESGGVGEAAGGESGIGELPEEEVVASLISTRL